MAERREHCPLPPNSPVLSSDKPGKGDTSSVPPKVPPRPGRQNKDESRSKVRVLSHSHSVATEPIPVSKRSKLTKANSLSTSALPGAEKRLLEEPLQSSHLHASEVTLQQLAKDFSQSFPLRIKVLYGYSGPFSEVTISTDDFYDVHFLKAQKVVVATDSQGEAYTIPLNTPLQFGLLYSGNVGKKQNEEKTYARVSDILAVTPLPKVICATKKYDGTDKSSSVEANEIMVVNRTIKSKLLGKKSIEVLSLRTKSKKVLGYECEGMFSLSPSKIRLYLPEITQCIDDPFPCQVILENDRPSSTPQYIPSSSLSGPVTLSEVKTRTSLIVSPAINEDDPSSVLTNILELPADGTLSMVKVTIVRTFEYQAEKLTNKTREIYQSLDLSHTALYPAAQDDQEYTDLQWLQEDTDNEYVTVNLNAVSPPRAINQESQWKDKEFNSTGAKYDRIEYHGTMYATVDFKPSLPSPPANLPESGAVSSLPHSPHSSKPAPLPRTQLPLQSSRKQDQTHSSPTVPISSSPLLEKDPPYARMPMETHYNPSSPIRGFPLPLPRRQSTGEKDRSALASPSESVCRTKRPSTDMQPQLDGASGTSNGANHGPLYTHNHGASSDTKEKPHYMYPRNVPLSSYSEAANIPEPHYMSPKSPSPSIGANIPEHLHVHPPGPHYMNPKPHTRKELSATPLYTSAYEVNTTRDRSIEHFTNALQTLNARMAKIEEDIENIKQRIGLLEERRVLLEGPGTKNTSSEQAGIKSDVLGTTEANRAFLNQLDVEGVSNALRHNIIQRSTRFIDI